MLEDHKYYHIYNRGVNGTNLFYEKRNYYYFLEKYTDYMSDILNTYAYCLMGNHFHFLVSIKDLSEIKEKLKAKEGLHHPDQIVSKRFADFFNSYTKSINKTQMRTGALFETPFKRIELFNNHQFTWLIWYIHFNPQKHGFVKDFKNYPYTSYHSHLSLKPTKLCRKSVLEWFGGKVDYIEFHEQQQKGSLDEFVIEFD